MWSWRRRRELSCKQVVAMVTDYLDGALSPRERRRFERHLEACAQCPEYVAQIRAVVQASGCPDPAEPPARSDDELRALFQALRSE